MKAKKKNPQDATLRNIRALKKRVDTLEECLISFMNLSGTLSRECQSLIILKLRGKK